MIDPPLQVARRELVCVNFIDNYCNGNMATDVMLIHVFVPGLKTGRVQGLRGRRPSS